MPMPMLITPSKVSIKYLLQEEERRKTSGDLTSVDNSQFSRKQANSIAVVLKDPSAFQTNGNFNLNVDQMLGCSATSLQNLE